jgi:sulfotransferase
MKTYYFISGLPRSGSTLLSAILKQNPKFYADIASPMSGIFKQIITSFTLSENKINIYEQKRCDSLIGFAEGYYKDIDCPVVFDSCRDWTSKTPLLKTVFPYTKIICCVRDIPWILDSFERISNRNSLSINTLINEDAGHCVDTRCTSMMDPLKNGHVYKPLKHLEDGLMANPEMICLVEYENLCKNPEKEIRKIYEFIGMDYYDHDFNSVDYKNEMFDLSFGMRDLHTVKKQVRWESRDTILPKHIWDRYSGLEFWRDKSQLMYE